MKKLLIAVFLGLLCTTAMCQTKITTERSLHIKTLDQNNIDSYLAWTGTIKNKDTSLSFTFGYGQTIAGNGWMQAKNSWGNVPFGSGIMNSPLFQAYQMAGPEYTSQINNFGWGSNGFNFMMNGTVGKFSLGGAYSGYNNLTSFSFSGATNTFTGKGIFIMRENKVEQFRTDMEFKF
jgi:hypothetical protein